MIPRDTFTALALLAALLGLAAPPAALSSAIPPQCVCAIRAKVLACDLDTREVEAVKEADREVFAAMTVEVLAVDATLSPHSDGKTTGDDQYRAGQVIGATVRIPRGDPILAAPGALEPGAVVRGDVELLGGSEMGPDGKPHFFSGYVMRNLKPGTP